MALAAQLLVALLGRGDAAPTMPASGSDSVSMMQVAMQSKKASRKATPAKVTPHVVDQNWMDDPFWTEARLQSTTGTLDGIPVFRYDRAATKLLSPRSQWILVYFQNATHDMMSEGCDEFELPAKCDYVSNPEKGELAFASVHAYESELKSSRFHKRIPFTTKYMQIDGTASLGEEAMHQRHSSSSSRPLSWGLDRIDGPLDHEPYSIRDGGKGVHVWNLDTGVRDDDAEFKNNKISREMDMTYDFLACSSLIQWNPFKDKWLSMPKSCKERESMEKERFGETGTCSAKCGVDRHGHGTHTMANICGKEYGVAKAASCHSLKVLNDMGMGAWGWFGQGINFVVGQKAKYSPSVISGSLGGPGIEPFIKDIIDHATQEDIFVVVAAGNQGEDACKSTPGFIDSAVVVGATGQDDRLPKYSNFGRCIDLYAPGTNVPGPDILFGGELFLTGTSQSCPLVTGALALELSPYDGMGMRSTVSSQAAMTQLLSISLPYSHQKGEGRLLQVRDKKSPHSPGVPTAIVAPIHDEPPRPLEEEDLLKALFSGWRARARTRSRGK